MGKAGGGAGGDHIVSEAFSGLVGPRDDYFFE